MPRDVYDLVTAQIIEALESAEAAKFQMPWNRISIEMPLNAHTQNAYRGINILSLWCAALSRDFETPYFATYRQWSDLGAQVRKGEKGSTVVFFKEYDVEKVDDDDNGKRFVARASTVFNASQVDGWTPPELDLENKVDPIEAADRLIAATKADIKHQGARACYRPLTDDILLPERQRFFDTDTRSATEAYYSVALHELAHWTGAEHRLNRDLLNEFGSPDYAREELVAELSAAMACATLGIEQPDQLRDDHTAYLASWLRVLKSDKKAIFAAASQASKAVDYLLDFLPAAMEEEITL